MAHGPDPSHKLDPNLQSRLAVQPDAPQPVVVSFRRWLSVEEAAALALGGDGQTATGILTPRQIAALAANDEVVQIALVPDSAPSVP
jgi:hypothetical protein